MQARCYAAPVFAPDFFIRKWAETFFLDVVIGEANDHCFQNAPGAAVYRDDDTLAGRAVLYHRVTFIDKECLAETNRITRSNQQFGLQARVIEAGQRDMMNHRPRVDSLFRLAGDRNIKPVPDFELQIHPCAPAIPCRLHSPRFKSTPRSISLRRSLSPGLCIFVDDFMDIMTSPTSQALKIDALVLETRVLRYLLPVASITGGGLLCPVLHDVRLDMTHMASGAVDVSFIVWTAQELDLAGAANRFLMASQAGIDLLFSGRNFGAAAKSRQRWKATPAMCT